MPRSKANWAAFFKRSDPKNLARRKKRGEKIKERKATPATSTLAGLVLPRVVGDASFYTPRYNKSQIRKNAEERRAEPTPAEAELERILNSLNGGVLRGRFKREHVVSGKWIVDFFFPEIRLAIEIDGSIHDTPVQRAKDLEKDADCKRFDITILRLRNAEIFGHRDRLVQKLRAGWRAAKNHEKRTIGKTYVAMQGDGSMKAFASQIYGAVRGGRLIEPFDSEAVKEACPGWADGTYKVFLSKHAVGNGTTTELFVRVSPGRYRLNPKLMH